jgi:hypothetical protein
MKRRRSCFTNRRKKKKKRKIKKKREVCIFWRETETTKRLNKKKNPRILIN